MFSSCGSESANEWQCDDLHFEFSQMISLPYKGRSGATQLFVMQINNELIYRNHSVFWKALESASVVKKLAEMISNQSLFRYELILQHNQRLLP